MARTMHLETAGLWICSPADVLMKATASAPHPSWAEYKTREWCREEPPNNCAMLEECIYCISKGNGNMSKAFSPLPLKVFSFLPQNYTHLTLLKRALTRDERGGRPKALHSVNSLPSTSWPKSHLFWFTAASTVSVLLSSIILLNALTIRVCPEREYTLVSQL